MNFFKHSIKDDAVRDLDNDNILKEDRVEKKYILGVCYWFKVVAETNEYVKVEKRKLGYGK